MPYGVPTTKVKYSRSLPFLPTYSSTETSHLSSKSSLTKLFHWLGLKKNEYRRKWQKPKITQVIQRILKKKVKKRKRSSEKFICVPSLYLYEKFPSISSGLNVKPRVFRKTTSDSGLNYKFTYDQPVAKPDCSYKVTLDGMQFDLDELFVECTKQEALNLRRNKLRNFKGSKMNICESPTKVKTAKSPKVNVCFADENKQNSEIEYGKRQEPPLRSESVTVQLGGGCIPKLPQSSIERSSFQPMRRTLKKRSMMNPSEISLENMCSKQQEKQQRLVNDDATCERNIDKRELTRVTNSLKGMTMASGKEVSNVRNLPEASKFAMFDRDLSKYSTICPMLSKAIAHESVECSKIGRENVEKNYVSRRDRGESPEDINSTCYELKKTTSQKTNLARMGSKLEISCLKRLKDFIRTHHIDYGKLEFKERLALQWVESKDSRKPLHIDLSPKKAQETRPFSSNLPPPSSRFVPSFPTNRKFVFENRTCCVHESWDEYVEPKVVGSFSEETLPFDSLFVPVRPPLKVESDKIRTNLWQVHNKSEDNSNVDRNPPIFKSIV